jgi:hypothetical protein
MKKLKNESDAEFQERKKLKLEALKSKNSTNPKKNKDARRIRNPLKGFYGRTRYGYVPAMKRMIQRIKPWNQSKYKP